MSTLQERFGLAFQRRQHRATKGEKVTKAALAAACGVKPPSVSDWFSGRTTELKGPSLIAAARYLQVRPDWLAHGKGPMELGGALAVEPEVGLSEALIAIGKALERLPPDLREDAGDDLKAWAHRGGSEKYRLRVLDTISGQSKQSAAA